MGVKRPVAHRVRAMALSLLAAWAVSASADAGGVAAAPSGGAAAAAAAVAGGAGEVTVPPGVVSAGDVNLAAGTVTVDGTLRGSVSLQAGRVSVGRQGRVTGAVNVAVGVVQVAPGGRIDGPVTVGDQSVTSFRCPAGAAGGPCTLAGVSGRLRGIWRLVCSGCATPPGGWPWRLLGLTGWLGWSRAGLHLLRWLGLLALALPVAAIWPVPLGGVRRQVETDPGRSALAGLLAPLLAAPVLLIVSVTIVGIPVALAAALGLAAAWFFGYVAVANLVGGRTGALLGSGSEPAPLWAIVLGSAILAAAGLVPVLGGLVGFAAGCAGLGAVLLSRFGTGRPWLPSCSGAASSAGGAAARGGTGSGAAARPREGDGTGAGADTGRTAGTGGGAGGDAGAAGGAD